VVDDEGLDGAAGGFELEAELLLNCGEDVGSRIRRGGGSLVVPLSVYTRFIDLVGVTVLYRQIVVDSVGVMALYIHGDLCFPYGFAVSFCEFRVRRPGVRFEPLLFMRGDPLCIYIYSRFVDAVGVTVLYRQMVVDSVGVTALYIHVDLCFPYGFA
jgi:hypothetical protein